MQLSRYEQELTRIKSARLYRQPFCVDGPQGPTVYLQNKELINFCSNDYLGLANDVRLINALKASAERHGVGSGASQMVCGRSHAHAELEESLAEHTGRDKVLLFSSGYLANVAIISTLAANDDDLVLEDKLSHASAIDGALLSRAKLRRYLHSDLGSLSKQLKVSAQNKLVFTESVFSMDGDIAPLPETASVCEQEKALLLADDAHGFGVLGVHGGGVLEHFGLTQEAVPIMMATFGKALGGFGAFVAGPEGIMSFLAQKARPLIYSTALPPAIAATNLEALKLVQTDPERREKLFALIARFKQGAKQLALPLKESNTPIQPLMLGEPAVAMQASENLFEKGFLIGAIRPPTVPPNTSRLRITFSARHSEQQVDCLLEGLATMMKELEEAGQSVI